MLVAPAWERGLKYCLGFHKNRSLLVAPAWERGLKCLCRLPSPGQTGRSRLGAWIEMGSSNNQHRRHHGRSRLGAWIEIDL